MTDGAGDPHRAEPVAAEEATDADDRVQLEERERHLRVVQVDFPSLDRRRDALRDPSCIDLEPDRERRLRADPRSDSAVLAPGNRAVQLQRAAPERLVAEAVEAKNLPPAGEHAARRRRGCSPRLRGRARHSRDGAVHDDDRKVEDERRSPMEGQMKRFVIATASALFLLAGTAAASVPYGPAFRSSPTIPTTPPPRRCARPPAA